MLRDLDKRKSTYSQSDAGVDSARITPAANSTDKVFARRWVWLVAIVGLLFLMAFVWHLYGELESKVLQDNERLAEVEVVQTLMPEPAAQPVIVAQAVAPKAAFTDILNVSVLAIAGGARIEIRLSAPVQHRVLRNGQELIIDLPATRLVQGVPNLTRHPLISAADVLSHAGGTQLEVDVSQPVTLQTSLVSKQQTLLIIELITEQEPAEQRAETVNRSENSSQHGDDFEGLDSTEMVNKTKPSFEKTTRQLTLVERDQQTNQQALQHMRAGRTQTANELLSKLIQEYPEAHQSRATLVALTLSQGYAPQAERLLAQGLQLAPQQLAFIKLKARLLLSQQQVSQAVKVLSAQLDAGAEDQELLALLASASQRDGQHERALQLYQQLLTQNNRQPQWWVGKAISLEALKQKAAALKAYVQARSITGISPALKAYAEGRINQLQ